MKRTYSMKELRNSYPRGKWEPLWTRLFLRPLSYPIAWVFVRLKFSANQVSIFSIGVSLLAALMMAPGSGITVVVGAILFNVSALLDCVDGHVARVKKEASIYGGWMDALGGYVTYTCVLLAVGIVAEATKPVSFMPINFVLLGSLAAVSNLLMRLEYQHFRFLRGQGAEESIKREKRIGANLGITGFLMPMVLVGTFFKILPLIILFYCVFYLCACILVTIRMIRMVQKMQDQFLLKG